MTRDVFEPEERLVLGDLINRVLDKGAVISGEVTISVADIDLIRLGLNLVISSAERKPSSLPAAPPRSAIAHGDADPSLRIPGRDG
ncbi:MAG: gas vesicle protein [Gemmatimonadaceae bacterium]